MAPAQAHAMVSVEQNVVRRQSTRGLSAHRPAAALELPEFLFGKGRDKTLEFGIDDDVTDNIQKSCFVLGGYLPETLAPPLAARAAKTAADSLGQPPHSPVGEHVHGRGGMADSGSHCLGGGTAGR